LEHDTIIVAQTPSLTLHMTEIKFCASQAKIKHVLEVKIDKNHLLVLASDKMIEVSLFKFNNLVYKDSRI